MLHFNLDSAASIRELRQTLQDKAGRDKCEAEPLKSPALLISGTNSLVYRTPIQL
jgi:hypothetical protein